VVRHPAVVRCVDGAAEGRRIAEARVVDEDHQDVRRPVGRSDVADRVPVKLRAVERPVGHTPEWLLADRKLAAVELTNGDLRGLVTGLAID